MATRFGPCRRSWRVAKSEVRNQSRIAEPVSGRDFPKLPDVFPPMVAWTRTLAPMAERLDDRADAFHLEPMVRVPSVVKQCWLLPSIEGEAGNKQIEEAIVIVVSPGASAVAAAILGDGPRSCV